MKQVLIKDGAAVIEVVPAPQVEPDTVLVEVDYSCISVGTEMAGIRNSGTPLWKRALKEPGKVKRALEMAATKGIGHTTTVIRGQLNAGSATGYSAAGRVLEVGPGVKGIEVGQRIACAGAQCAHHAEYIRVPRNLLTPIPDEVDTSHASTVTLGAIALQGVRRAAPTLGESFVVIGLGILGQLTAQMLRANGCRVIGTDVDSGRIGLALEQGMDLGINPMEEMDVDHVHRLTDGIGADGVIVTAASPSNEIVSTAFKMCRRKGRVVLVGDVGLDIRRGDIYAKELDFFVSTSYGPGRYDANYEEQGLDYPVAYVRWTENRNMAEYLRLLETKRLAVAPLIAAEYELDSAPQAYQALKEGENKPLMVLLHYPRKELAETVNRKVPNPHAAPRHQAGEQVHLAVVGAGGFAKGMHLPNIQNLENLYRIRAIVSRTGHNAMATAKQYEADYSTTDYQQVLNDQEINAVLISTRHDLHAPMVLQALHAGKHVMVEKPLALQPVELESIISFYEANPQGPMLLTGFNRRFSPHIQRIKEIVSGRSNPMIINYRMNAGYIPLDHWVHSQEGGGRNIGEACHIYDLFTFLTGANNVAVNAQAITPVSGHYARSDNFVATVSFDDGSVATLTYTALGAKEYPKEKMEIYVDGKVIVMDDYKSTIVHGANAAGITTKLTEKGQKQEVTRFAEAILRGGEWPIPLIQQIGAMNIAFLVEGMTKG